VAYDTLGLICHIPLEAASLCAVCILERNMITIYRAAELYNAPRRSGQPTRRGMLGVGRSHFYDEIEPRLEKVRLGEKAVGYTSRSVERIIREGIAAAIAERNAKSVK
jgi:predicted DNA-binding transcriptional regulator AlpA